MLAELDRLHITPSSSPSPVDEEEQENLSPEQENHFPEEENLSPEQVRVLQQSFAALKQRFYDLMTEKVAMHDQLQEREHIIVQLAGETETIAEYVALYQTQREALKIRFQEKNRLIQQLAQEKAALEVSGLPLLMNQDASRSSVLSCDCRRCLLWCSNCQLLERKTTPPLSPPTFSQLVTTR